MSAAALSRELLHLEVLADTTVMGWCRADGEAVDLRAQLRGALDLAGDVNPGPVGEQRGGGRRGGVSVATVAVETGEQPALSPVSMGHTGRLLRGSRSDLLLDLRAFDFQPSLIVTDGSSLHPGVLEVDTFAEKRRRAGGR